MAGTTGLVEVKDDNDATVLVAEIASDDEEEESLILMTQSLFVLPEAFGEDEELLEEALKTVDDPEVVYVAGDVREDIILTEDESMAILANYGQVRRYLHKKKLGRGFHRPKPPNAKRKGGCNRRSSSQTRSTSIRIKHKFKKRRNPAPKRWSKKKLMSRSKCARCGQVGHWARECTNPPDERGRKRMQGNYYTSSMADETPAVVDPEGPSYEHASGFEDAL